MNMYKKLILLLGIALLTNPIMARAEEPIEDAEAQITEEVTQSDYSSRLKEKYNLTDEQIQKLKDSKISESQFAVVGALAKESGKTVDEVLKMRTEDKMGWGKIAKELGLEPKMIGQSVASMHRQNEDKVKKEEKKEMRETRKSEKKERREEKRTARKENRDQKKDRKNQ